MFAILKSITRTTALKIVCIRISFSEAIAIKKGGDPNEIATRIWGAGRPPPLRVEVQGSYILVAMRGTCVMAKYRNQEAPWLAMDGYAEDLEDR